MTTESIVEHRLLHRQLVQTYPLLFQNLKIYKQTEA